MKTKFSLPLLGVLFMLLWGCAPKEQFKVGEKYHGFTLVQKKFVNEVNAECLLFKHDKSGAQLLKIAADDPNKLFNIAFKTAPENDYGTPHIMEHSVLNGSKNFPVKSPFDVLMKGSLNTFLNAMTGSDITTFPVASMNDKDYFNLMHVYLDAVFNPLLYSDPRILEQEGWHYELNDKEGDVVYKGVVYNEMKGAYSSPRRELGYQVDKILFPDNTYGVSSGGYPTEIPNLTHQYFVNFHKKFYHPSNSYILLYGNADLDKELSFIDSEYLSKYDDPGTKIEIPLQKPFNAMKTAEKTYAVPEGAPTKDQTFLSLSFVAGKSTDRPLSMAFDVLTDALVNHESAPVRVALQKAGIGRDVHASFNEAQQNTFQITVQNANPEDKDRFREIVFKTLEKISEEGFDKSMIKGILNRMEFNLKEGNTPQKGLMYLMMSYQTWFFANDPFLGLEFNKPLEEVKKGVDTNMLQSIVEEYLFNNPHALLMVFKPEPGLQAKIDAETTKKLKAYKAGLKDEQLDNLVSETKALVDYQKKEDTPEALASIPLLSLSDISKDIEWFNVDQKQVADVPVLHHDAFTNNILYSSLYFDIRALPKELIPYSKLLSSLLGKLNTENYSFGELDNALNINTGGFNTYTTYFLENDADDQLLPKFVVTTKATTDRADKLFELVSEILQRSKLDDTERLEDLITRQQSRVESNIKNNGLNYALTRARSYYSNAGMFNELVSGLQYYRFITDLAEDFDSKSDEIEANLKKTAALLFAKANLTGAITCDKSDFSAYSGGFEKMVAEIPAGSGEINNWKFDFQKKNEGMLTASKVQYVVKGYDFKKLGFNYDGKMKVLDQVLSTDWLQNQVRVIGGAYGGFCGFSPSGNVYFASYRDPNLKETLDNYDNTPGYLKDFKADDKEMTRFIIGTISQMDQPMTVSQEGNQAVQYYFSKETPEKLKAEREAVLSVTSEDIRQMSTMVQNILDQNVICVYGNEDKLKSNESLFGGLVSITD